MFQLDVVALDEKFVRQLLIVVGQELKHVVPSSGRGRLGPSVIDCPRSRSSGW